MPDLVVDEDRSRVTASVDIGGRLGGLDASARGALTAIGDDRVVGGRVGVGQDLDTWSWDASLERRPQFLYSLRNEESFLSSLIGLDLLVPASGRRRVAIATEAEVQLERSWSRSRVSGGFFVRRTGSLPMPSRTQDPIEDPMLAPPASLEVGRERARGIELEGSAASSKRTVHLSYSWVRVERGLGSSTFGVRSGDGQEVDMAWSEKVGSSTVKVSASARSGLRYTPLVGVLELPGASGPTSAERLAVLGEYNGARLPAYVRLDVGWEGRFEWSMGGRRVDVRPYVTLVNVLNRRNPMRAQLRTTGASRITYSPQVPILPMLGVSWTF